MNKLPGIKQSIQTGAGYGALALTAVTADAGNPLINAAAGAVIGAGVGLGRGIRNAVQNQKNRNLGRQFNKVPFKTEADYSKDL
jgi:uncharacterized membrane protein YqgA involved in biofilm formation